MVKSEPLPFPGMRAHILWAVQSENEKERKPLLSLGLLSKVRSQPECAGGLSDHRVTLSTEMVMVSQVLPFFRVRKYKNNLQVS